MRLVCSVNVINKLLQNVAINQMKKHVKSTLALCKKPKSEEYCIILFTAQHKNGTKYEINKNISQILTRFIHEGKATIQFRKPEHDLQIQGDVIQLKGFLHLLKRILENKISTKELTISSMAVTAVSTKTIALKKLIILKRSDYPQKGFPRTLEILQINGIQRCSLDRGILQLAKLRILDLSDNLIEFLPVDINNLPNLSDLNVSSNQLGKSAPRSWDWMGGKLSKSLKLLNLTNNNLKYLPDQLIKLYNIISLHVDKNELSVLPSGIGNLKHLKILTASNNQLKTLPGSSKKWRLDNLDLSYNSFGEQEQCNPAAILPKNLPVCSLKEYSAKKVLYARISYNSETLPITLMKYLDLAKYCVCGKACFNHFIKYTHMLLLSSVSMNLSVSFAGLENRFVPMDCYFCSLKCFSSANYNRERFALV